MSESSSSVTLHMSWLHHTSEEMFQHFAKTFRLGLSLLASVIPWLSFSTYVSEMSQTRGWLAMKSDTDTALQDELKWSLNFLSSSSQIEMSMKPQLVSHLTNVNMLTC